jgi:hypothetical protein
MHQVDADDDREVAEICRGESQVVVEWRGGRLHDSCLFRVCISALSGDFSFTRVIVLLTASTTGQKEVFLSVAQDFRKLAKEPTCVLF